MALAAMGVGHAEESLALVALSRAVARADGAVTPLEGEAIAVMAASIDPSDTIRQIASVTPNTARAPRPTG